MIKRKTTIRSLYNGALHILLCAVLFLLLASCALLCVETIWRGSFSEAMMWATRLNRLMVLYTVNIALVEAMLYLLSGRMFFSVLLTNVVLMLAALVQHYKLEFRGENFMLGDIWLASEAAAILDKFTVTLPWYVALGCVLLLAAPLCVWGIRLRRCVVMRTVSFCACAVLLFNINYASRSMYDARSSARDYYNLNGLISGLIWSRPRTLTAPENYSEESIRQILCDYEQEDTVEVLPDILFIMSESLYDLGRLESMKLSADTMPYFRTLQEEYWGCQVCVAPIGGATVQSEYSMLTGYLPDTKIVSPYLHKNLVYEGMDSIPRLLSEYGYYTMAMHPNEGTMYERSSAYPRLGFNEMLFEEQLPRADDYVGSFPSDAYLFQEIIRSYENRPKDKPWFSFVVTFQNHGAYDYSYDKWDIEVTDAAGNLRTSATTYANALKASDEALQTLIAYFEKQERPVVIMIFGDHAPALQSLGYARKAGLDEEYLTHTTPGLVYSNYGLEMPPTEVLSSYRLGATVLHAIGLRRDSYYNYLADPSRENLHAVGGVLIDQQTMISDEERYARAMLELELIHYDRVAGERYGRKDGDADE